METLIEISEVIAQHMKSYHPINKKVVNK
jgi:hypothetical protein